MEQSTHQMYKASSPYYRSILAQYGRKLTVGQVKLILAEHSLTLIEYLADKNMPFLMDETDAAELIEWLGY
jgi:hypothetical protein